MARLLEAEMVGRLCYPRKTSKRRQRSGKITATSCCQLDGCPGRRLHVKWPSGNLTKPCSRGCFVRKDGDWQIGVPDDGEVA